MNSVPPRSAAIEEHLSRAVNGGWIGKSCYAFHEIPSTMDLAHQLAPQEPEGVCVWAERQTGGRGRAGRQWSSPAGGVYCSVVLHPTRSQQELPQLALVAGLAVVQAIHEVTGISASIRWPNDVMLEGKKVAGILTEAKTFSTQHTAHSTQIYVVVGMGINVETNPRDLPETATSLAQQILLEAEVSDTSTRTKSVRHFQALDRFALAATVFRRLEQVYRQWNADGFTAIRPLLVPWVGFFGQLVHITTARETFDGQATDLDESGRLLVRLDSGFVRAFEAAEVTLLR